MGGKTVITVLVLRAIQLIAAVAFFVFWTWTAASDYFVAGGAGEIFFGYFTTLASMVVCAHTIRSFVRKEHLKTHPPRYYNIAWATDIAAVVLWLGVILVNILVPLTPEQWKQRFGPMTTQEAGFSGSELVLVITFFMTMLLHMCSAFGAWRAGRATRKGKGEVRDDEEEVVSGVTAPQAAHVAEQASQTDAAHEVGAEETGADGVQAPRAAHVRDI